MSNKGWREFHMQDMKLTEGDTRVNRARVAIVSARFNVLVVDGLVRGALEALQEAGMHPRDIDHVRVPGAFELPLAVKTLAESNEFDAIIALGAVIRGDTAHFEYVCRACTDGLLATMLNSGVPVGFGVLTVDDTEQALARAADDGSNKGREAALAAVEMLNLLKEVR